MRRRFGAQNAYPLLGPKSVPTCGTKAGTRSSVSGARWAPAIALSIALVASSYSARQSDGNASEHGSRASQPAGRRAEGATLPSGMIGGGIFACDLGYM